MKPNYALFAAYKLEVKDASGKWKLVKEDIDPMSTSHTVKGLKESVPYLFRVSAVNDMGVGEPLALDRPVTPRQRVAAPSCPRGPLTVSDMDETSVTVGWRESEQSGGSQLAGYVVEVRESIRARWTQVK